jgi:U3 small nucleolar RNA-associated protein 20
MRHLVDVVAFKQEDSGGYRDVFVKLLYPGLKNGLRSKNDLARAEVLGVIGYAVEKLSFIAMFKEMQILLEAGDAEANFFNNIIHVQLHRRSRALKRLGDHCDEGKLRSTTLSEIFIPLVGHYIASTATVDHHLVTDAITATGRMAKQLNWPAYYALIQKYIKLSKAKDESERVYVRTLVGVLDSFHFPIDETTTEVQKDETENDLEDGLEEVFDNNLANEGVTTVSVAQTSRIADTVSSRLLPALLDYLEKHDSTTDDNTRIPVSIGIVAIAKHLPGSTREVQITRLLTILSQILRSRSQETRDLTRDALLRISISLGPEYLPLTLKELRSALTRGPQLHVLAFVTHAILVQATSPEHVDRFSNLDDCVNDVAHVSAEVIFGESGKDVLSEDFKTKMREVRGSSSRGLDSFSTIAKVISSSKISSLLAPLRSIMQETESLKLMQLVDEALKRIASGLNSNQHLLPTDLIVLCNTLISQNAKFLKQIVEKKKKSVPKGDAIVQLKRNIVAEADHYTNNSFRFVYPLEESFTCLYPDRFVAFGLDLFNTALRRSRFDFRDAEAVKRLESMVVVIGNALYSTNAPVIVLSLKCAAGLTKCPLKNLPKSVPVFISQMIDIIRRAGNTESETTQVAFKSLATILRDFPNAQVREKDLVFLLELLSPDLEDHERQATVFTMLRAIVARKFVVPEIYVIMDKVGEIMVTGQSPQVQGLCRGVLLQFLLDYPQGKGRLRNQMTFLAKNLSYVHESGRKSVMELLNAIITKFQAGLIQTYADLLFVALVMVIANDDSAKCREMAATLITSLYGRLDDERRKVIFSHLHTWATQGSQVQLVWVSSQIYGFIVDAVRTDVQPYIGTIVEDLWVALVASAQFLARVEEGEGDVGMDVDLEWKVPYHSLTVLFKVFRVFPDFCKQDTKVPWNLVTSHLLYPHAWVRTAACRLLGLLFNALPIAPPRTDLPDGHPVSLVGMKDIAKKLFRQLRSEYLDETLGMQVVKNLFFVGKCFCAMPKEINPTSAAELSKELMDEDTVDRNVDKVLTERKDLLPWLFSKLSYQVKSAHIARRSRFKSSVRTDIKNTCSASLIFCFLGELAPTTPGNIAVVCCYDILHECRKDGTVPRAYFNACIQADGR